MEPLNDIPKSEFERIAQELEGALGEAGIALHSIYFTEAGERSSYRELLEEIRSGDPRGVEHVRETLAYERDLTEQNRDHYNKGKGFAESFMRDLSASAYDPEAFMEKIGAPAVDATRLQELSEAPDCQGAGIYGLKLAKYGITPLQAYLAARAVASLVDDLMEDGEVRLTGKEPVRVLGKNRGEVQGESQVEWKEATSAITFTTSLESETSDALFSWLIEVSKTKPFVIDGYRAACDGEDLLLYRHEMRDNFVATWGLMAKRRP